MWQFHSELGKGMNCDFKPGSVERSIHLDKEVYLSSQFVKIRYQ
jgi:hypothetical protein